MVCVSHLITFPFLLVLITLVLTQQNCLELGMPCLQADKALKPSQHYSRIQSYKLPGELGTLKKSVFIGLCEGPCQDATTLPVRIKLKSTCGFFPLTVLIHVLLCHGQICLCKWMPSAWRGGGNAGSSPNLWGQRLFFGDLRVPLISCCTEITCSDFTESQNF